MFNLRFLLELSYRGTSYFGWQVQSEGTTVQGVLQEKLSLLLQQVVEIVGCGRTDSGVHASQYFAHFDVPESCVNQLFLKSMNAMLPKDIAILSITQVADDFHARFDAILRKYIYRIHLNKDPFAPFYSYYLRETNFLSIDLLNQAAKLILQIEDFRSFVKTGNELENFYCKIYESQWIQIDENHFEYHIAANRFVRGMVRLIVGMSINFTLNKITMDQIENDLKAYRQITKSWSISAEGLSLVEIQYPKNKLKQL